MDYNIIKNNSNIDSNFTQNKIDKEYRDFVNIKKNIKNISINQVDNLQNKINELENKLEFYKKYENNLSCVDLKIINNSIETIDNLIESLTKNIISNLMHIRQRIKNTLIRCMANEIKSFFLLLSIKFCQFISDLIL